MLRVLMPSRQRAVLAGRHDDSGFTMIELVVALGLIAAILTSASMVSASAMRTYSGARIRSAFVELTTGELESLRSATYERVGVASNDPNVDSAYPGGLFEGRPKVVAANASKPAVSIVTSSAIPGIQLPYTVRRWVTWTDTAAGSGASLKRLTVKIEWHERTRARSYRLVTVLYPGGRGSGDAPPTAVLTASATDVEVGTAITFSSAGSSDPEGQILTYAWDFGDGGTASGATATKSYATPGTYTARLTVTDPARNADAHTATILVRGVNQPPVASFSVTATSGLAPLSVSFDAGASSDPEGAALTYTWSWGDGTPNGSGVNASHTFVAEGSFVTTLTVKDPYGLSGTATQTITASSLVCAINTSRFTNPPGSSTRNDIVVDNSQKPTNPDIRFTVETNVACTSVTTKITLESGSLTVTLIKDTEASGVKTWRKTITFASSDKVPTGCRQTATASAAGTGTALLSWNYSVHKSSVTCPAL